MNINDITIGEARELVKIFSPAVQSIPVISAELKESTDIYSEFVGKYVICRSRNEGVNCGLVTALDSTGVVLSDARRLYYHKPLNKNVSWYEGVARSGISTDSKIGCAVDKIIAEDYSLTICTDAAKESLSQANDNAQN